MISKKMLCTTILILTAILTKMANGGKGGNRIGDACTSDSDCSYDIDNSECQASTKTCVCQQGYYQIDDTYCSLVLGDRNFGCLSDCDCASYVPNTRCLNKIVCACKDGYIKKNNNTCVAAP